MPPSVTIKIDLGAESATGTTNNVSLQGDIPTPLGSLSVVGSGATLGQSGGALPTPFDNAAQATAVLNDQSPTPVSGGTGLLTDQTAPAPSPDTALGGAGEPG